MAMMTEDEVRDSAKTILGFDKVEDGVLQGTGQITTFNQLGITGEGKDKKPDGWYLPQDKGAIAIILETKNSEENLGKKAHMDELLRNCRIVLDAGWKNVVGLLYNGKTTKGFINNIDIEVPDVLQDKSVYFKLVTDKSINKSMIYTLTARINNCLHTEFGVKNLYHRMIFTACALVAERYGAQLAKVKNMGYEVFHTAIRRRLEEALKEDKQQNGKIEILLDVYSEIKMNVKEKQKAIDEFIDCVIAVSDCINSNQWHGEDVMGIFFNEFNRYKKKSDAGQVFTPDHITSFMYRLINVCKFDYVGDFACGSGAFLVKAMSNMIEEAGGVDTKEAKEIRQTHLFGIEFDREIYALACANMLIHKDGKTNLTQLDTREQEACDWIKSKPISKVLMNPPFEKKHGCIQIVKNVLDNVGWGTECAFIMPDKKLEKSSKHLVAEILKHNRLLTIVKLPENLFFGVGVTTSIFVFKAGEAQRDREIFTCWMEDDGLETVKNKGRHDVKNRWPAIEDYWIQVVDRRNDERYHTHRWIKPSEHLSYQMPEKPFTLYEDDFIQKAMDYEMFKRGIDEKFFGETLLHKVLYSSRVEKKKGDIVITLKNGNQHGQMIDTSYWMEKRIGDLMKTKNTGNILSRDVEDGSGTTPFVTASGVHNGVVALIDASGYELIEGGCILVGGKTFTMTYQREDFVSNDSHNFIARLKQREGTEAIYLFLITVIKSVFAHKFSWSDAVTKSKFENETIPLPVDAEGNPDWKYMEDCMKRKEERARKTMDCLSM